MKNNKGMTIMEIVLSVALISIVLLFLMSLFMNVRSVYINNKAKTDYEIVKSSTIKAVASDINRYGLYSICRVNSSRVNLTFNEYREKKPNEKIRKYLEMKVEKGKNNNDKYYISYKYNEDIKDLSSEEKVLNFVRETPTSTATQEIEIEYSKPIVKLTLPLRDEKGFDYDIHIYAKVLSNQEDIPICKAV